MYADILVYEIEGAGGYPSSDFIYTTFHTERRLMAVKGLQIVSLVGGQSRTGFDHLQEQPFIDAVPSETQFRDFVQTA